MSILPWAENVGADAHHVAPLVEGNAPVRAHAHTHDIESAEVGGGAGADSVEDGADGMEVGTDSCGVVGVGSHAHHAAEMHGLKGRVLLTLKIIEQLLRRETGLGLFGCHMKLHEHFCYNTGTVCLVVNTFEKVDGVDALDKGSPADDLTHFVGLEMANEMPSDVVGHERNLSGQLLSAALAENALSGTVGLAKRIDGMEFGDGDKLGAIGLKLTVQPLDLR